MSIWQTVIAIDHDAHACRAYRANFAGVDVREAMVTPDLLRGLDIDVILGGPPCQPFSSAGKGDGEDDDRDVVPDYIACVDAARPRQFLMENAPTLIEWAKYRHYTAGVVAKMEALGYVVRKNLLDAVDYGAPQFRKRTWIWGIRRDLYDAGMRHAWPEPSHCWPHDRCGLLGLRPAVTTGQALGIWYPGCGFDEPEPNEWLTQVLRLELQAHGNNSGGEQPIDHPAPTMRACNLPGCSDVLVHEYRWSPAMLAKHPPAQPAQPAPTILSKFYKGGAEGLVEVLSEPSYTISGGGTSTGGAEPLANQAYREKFVRRLTVDECARLQSMPDSWVWPDDVAKTHRYRIVGNGWASAIGVAFGRAFAKVDPDARTVADLFCGGGLGAAGWHQRYWEYQA